MPRIVRPLAALLALVLPGCLCFERQSVVIRTPAKGQKTAQILLIYEGLFEARGLDGQDATRQLKELAVEVEGSRWYPGHVVPAGRLNAKSPQHPCWLALNSRHARILPATFFTGPAGRLNLYQVIEISDVPAFLDDLNGALSGVFIDDAAGAFGDAKAGQRNARLQEAIRLGHRWIEVEPGRVALTFPGTPEDLRHYRRRFFDPSYEFPRERQPGDNLAWLSGLAANPVNVEQRRDRLILAVGLGDGLPIDLTFQQTLLIDRQNERTDDRLTKHARTLGRPWLHGVTVEEVRTQFLDGKLTE